MEKLVLKYNKEAIIKDIRLPMLGLEDGAKEKEEQESFNEYVDCFAFNLHHLRVLKGEEVRINLMEDAPIYCKPYKYSELKHEMIQATTEILRLEVYKVLYR